MTKHLKLLMKTINKQAQEAQAQETFKNYTIIKLLKTSEKKGNLKSSQRESTHYMSEKQGKEKKNSGFFHGK